MILDQFPEIRLLVEDICKRACMKRLRDEAELEIYLEYLVGYTALATSWPVQFTNRDSRVLYGSILFPKQGTEEQGPIIVAIAPSIDDPEETVGHEIGHILITYYNFLFANDICFSQKTLRKKWRFLSNEMILINKETGMKFSSEWFMLQAENIRQHELMPNGIIERILEQEEVDAQDIQEVLCEEIAFLFVAERKKHEALAAATTKQRQATLF